MASRTCWICDSEGAGNLRCRMIPVNARSSIRADGVHSCGGMGNVLRCHLIAMRYVVEPGGASVAAGGKRFTENSGGFLVPFLVAFHLTYRARSTFFRERGFLIALFKASISGLLSIISVYLLAIALVSAEGLVLRSCSLLAIL